MKQIKLLSKLFEFERKKLIENMSAPIVLLFVVLLIITGSTINANTTSEKQQQQSSVATGSSGNNNSNNNPQSSIGGGSNNKKQQAPLAPTPLALQASLLTNLAAASSGGAAGPDLASLPQAGANQANTLISSQSSQAQQQQAGDVTSSAPKSGGPLVTVDDNDETDSLMGAAASQSGGGGGVESATIGMQAPSGSISPPSVMSSPASTSSSAQAHVSSHSSSSSSVYPPRLPKINIYANKNEVRKLLGIDTRINYVTNGQLNTYPLGFTIPMGYHLSDMIFTWQNLGPTSVNYSISLVIGNLQAVELPLINITRSGQIPRQEQVFKITLPCSGKVTDEVDVQVLINIMGLVPVIDDNAGQQRGHLSGGGPSEAGVGGGPDQVDQLDQVEQQQQQIASDYQLARAVQQQQNELAAAANNYISTGGNQSAPDQQMQADESKDGSKRVAPMRLVSHTLAIKRKKICTMHPVPVVPVTNRQPEIRPPNQAPSTLVADSTAAPMPSLANKLANQPSEQQAKDALRPMTPYRFGSQTPPQTWQPASAISIASVEPPSHQPGWPLATAITGGGSSGPSLFQTEPLSTPSPVPSIKQTPQATSSPQNPHNHNHPPHLHQHHHQWQPTPSGRLGQNHVGPTSATPSLNVPTSASQQQLPPLSPPSPPPPGDNPLIELLRHQQQQQAAAANSQPVMASGNPLLFTLIVMSLIISIALIALLIIGTSSSSSGAQASMRRHKHPLDKLNALTNCILRRTGAVGGSASRAVNKCSKSVPSVGQITINKNGAGFGIGTFAPSVNGNSGHTQLGAPHTMGRTSHSHTLAAGNRTSLGAGGAQLDSAGPKSSVLSTISGLQQQHHNKHHGHGTGHNHHHHHHHHHQQQHSSGSNNSALFNYYKQQQQQHGYSTATGTGGYYHHYQCPPDLLIGTTNNAFSSGSSSNGGGGGGGTTSPYHITMSNNQTTKLYFANNLDSTGTFTIDNNYTMTPGGGGSGGASQPRSDCSSVYQTIPN